MRARCYVGIVLYICCCASWCFADTIYFEKDRAFVCTVVSETADEVVVNTGSGQMIFAKKDISEIVRRDDNVYDGDTSGSRDVQSGGSAVAQGTVLIGNVRRARRQVQEAYKSRDVINVRLQEYEDALAQLHLEYEQLAAQDTAVDVQSARVTSRDKKRFFRHQDQLRELAAAITAKQYSMKQTEREQTATQRVCSDALTVLSKEITALKAYYRDRVAEQADGAFDVHMKHVQGIIAQYENDFQQVRIPLRRMGNSFVADVRVNDTVFVSLIVDTGATSMVITRALADTLGLAADEKFGKVMIRLADGSQTTGSQIFLNSVSVGNVRAEHVRAIAVNDAPNDNVDGLLGMSFLGRYVCKIDAQASALILENFTQ